MSVSFDSEPQRDTGTGEYPMTRPAEVTVDFEGGAESTMEYPMTRPAEVTVESLAETGSTGEYPTGVAVGEEPAEESEDVEPVVETPAVTEAENKIVEPDAKPRKTARARKTAPRKRA